MINNDMIAFDTYHSVWIGSVAICFDSRKRMCIFFEKILKMFFFFFVFGTIYKTSSSFRETFSKPPNSSPSFCFIILFKGRFVRLVFNNYAFVGLNRMIVSQFQLVLLIIFRNNIDYQPLILLMEFKIHQSFWPCCIHNFLQAKNR